MARRKKCPPCGGGWITTFADMATLLLTFFILMLSMSVIDVQRYKEVAESFQTTFGGLQRVAGGESAEDVEAAVNFGPGQMDARTGFLEGGQTVDHAPAESVKNLEEARREQIEARAGDLEEALRDPINRGEVELVPRSDSVIIRIQEKTSFPSGSATLAGGFGEVMDEIAQALSKNDDQIIVTGHTDDVPISSGTFRSNWDLSAARAVTVLHALEERGNVERSRLEARGMGENQPIAPNDTPENRALNRRVEIAVVPPINPEDRSTLEMLDQLRDVNVDQAEPAD
ncbi:MAG: flagellar motor protein MotB [Halothiobacillaceae bacterium]